LGTVFRSFDLFCVKKCRGLFVFNYRETNIRSSSKIFKESLLPVIVQLTWELFFDLSIFFVVFQNEILRGTKQERNIGGFFAKNGSPLYDNKASSFKLSSKYYDCPGNFVSQQNYLPLGL